MRNLEIVLLIQNLTAFLYLILPALCARFQRMRYFGLTIPPVIALHGIIEGLRWQMIPAYVIGSSLFLIFLRQIIKSENCTDGRKILKRIAISLGAILMAISIALPLIIPVFHFPKPTGQYEVGTLTYHWVDTNRQEVLTKDPEDKRELIVQIWYPAEGSRFSKHAPYIEDTEVFNTMGRLMGIPSFFLNHLKYVQTNAIPNAKMANGEESYPVLIFSHGRAGFRQHNTFQVEELVSHGYIVAAIDHPYVAAAVKFPDGRVAEMDARMIDNTFVNGIVPYLAQDESFTMDQLAVLNHDDPNGILTGRLDLKHAGIFGASLGGNVSTETCVKDSRFKACISLDVDMLPDVVEAGIRQPTMWLSRDAASMQREGWSQADVENTQATMRATFDKCSPGNGYLVLIPGMFHPDFSDIPLYTPLTSWIGMTGSLNVQREHKIVNDYSVAFFNQYLKDRPETLLDGPNKEYPEVLFEISQ